MEKQKLLKALNSLRRFSSKGQKLWMIPSEYSTLLATEAPRGKAFVRADDLGVDLCCVDFRRFAKAIDGVASDDVSFELENGGLLVSGGQNIAAIVSQNIPAPEFSEWSDGSAVSRESLNQCFLRVSVIDDPSEPNKARGILFGVDGNCLHLSCASQNAVTYSWLDMENPVSLQGLIAPHGVRAAIRCLTDRVIYVASNKSCIAMWDSDTCVEIPVVVDGKAPPPLSSVLSVLQKCNHWPIESHGIVEFVKQSSSLSDQGDMCKLTPDEMGLVCTFSGKNGGCNSVVDYDESNDLVGPAVMADAITLAKLSKATKEPEVMHFFTCNRALFISGRQYLFGMEANDTNAN